MKSRVRRSRAKQLSFPEPETWGGRRKGAGRKPKGERAGVSHAPREFFRETAPVHVTLRVRDHVYNLRSKRCFTAIKKAFHKGRDRFGFRLVHYSVQGNHIHLVCEAGNKRALSRGVQGLAIRLALGLNGIMGKKKGKVFADRYHVRILRSPTEVRNALQYLEKNARHHGIDLWMQRDVYCSIGSGDVSALVASAQTWVLKGGWKRGRAGPSPPQPSH